LRSRIFANNLHSSAGRDGGSTYNWGDIVETRY